jgi:hypothetical protein
MSRVSDTYFVNGRVGIVAAKSALCNFVHDLNFLGRLDCWALSVY